MNYFSYQKDLGNKVVVFSTDTNPYYYFFAPIATYIWSKIIGYSPLIFIVGNDSWFENKNKILVFESILNSGGSIAFLNSDKISNDERFSGYNLSMLAQISRFCSFCILNNTNIYALTSDVDMLPLNKNHFYFQDFNKPIHLFYANGYDHLRYTICYIGMNLTSWQKVMSIHDLNIYSVLSSLLRYLPKNSLDRTQWGYDEVLFYKQITQYYEYPKNVHMINYSIYKNPSFRKGSNGIPATLPMRRLDRSNWNFDMKDIRDFIDMHCPRPGYLQENWEKILFVLSFYLNQEDLKWVSEYHKMFMESL